MYGTLHVPQYTIYYTFSVSSLTLTKTAFPHYFILYRLRTYIPWSHMCMYFFPKNTDATEPSSLAIKF